MAHSRRGLAVLVMFVGLAPSLPAEEPAGSPYRKPRFDVQTTDGIVYGAGAVRSPQPGRKDLLLDLYQPSRDAADGLRPAFVVIHGGGFKGGNRKAPAMVRLCREFAARGYVCLSIDYRLMGDDPDEPGESPIRRAVAAAVRDGATAVQWLVDHAGDYRVDTRRIAIGGSSAGAITSLFVAYKRPQEATKRPPIAAVVDLWGSLYESVDEIQSGGPPVIIVHGTEDKVVRYAGSEAIVRRTKEVGVACELCAIEGAGHGVNLQSDYQGCSLTQRIANFLDVHMKLDEVAP